MAISLVSTMLYGMVDADVNNFLKIFSFFFPFSILIFPFCRWPESTRPGQPSPDLGEGLGEITTLDKGKEKKRKEMNK